MKKKGSITVYLLLLLTVFLLLVGAVFYSVRCRQAKTIVKTAARQSMMDLFSRYEPTLFEKYDLLFLDAGLGTNSFRGGLLLQCVEKNAAGMWGEGTAATNLCGLSQASAALQGYTLATDQNGEAFYRQAVEAAAQTFPAEAVKLAGEYMQQARKQENTGRTRGDVDKACTDYQKAVDKAQEGDVKDAGKDKTGDTKARPTTVQLQENPIDAVKKLQKKGLLGLVMPKQSTMSAGSVKKTTLLSARKLQRGVGLTTVAQKHSIGDRLLFTQYLGSHLSSFCAPDKEAALAWQLEYVIGQKTTDKANLKKTVEELLVMREGANLLYLKSDSQKLAEVHAMAASIAAALAVPVSEELIRRVLMVCWAYGESLMDVRMLLAGGKVPVVKDSASWQLEISRLAGVGDEQSKKGTKGLDYTGYLELLLQLQTEKNNIRRGMDMVELGMRGQEKKSSFSLDYCIEAASIELSARVSGAGTVRAVEYRSYEN